MKKTFKVGDFSKAKVSWSERKGQFKVVISSHDDVAPVEFTSFVSANSYEEAAEKGFNNYLNY